MKRIVLNPIYVYDSTYYTSIAASTVYNWHFSPSGSRVLYSGVESTLGMVLGIL